MRKLSTVTLLLLGFNGTLFFFLEKGRVAKLRKVFFSTVVKKGFQSEMCVFYSLDGPRK